MSEGDEKKICGYCENNAEICPNLADCPCCYGSGEEPTLDEANLFQEKVVARIDLSHGSRESHYVARLIWQELFNLYREGGGDLDQLDNLLCDLGPLNIFCGGTRACSARYWDFMASGFTSLCASKLCPSCYKIDWPIGSDTITISHNPIT